MSPLFIFSLAARTGIVRRRWPLLACGAVLLITLASAQAGLPDNLALGLQDLALSYQSLVAAPAMQAAAPGGKSASVAAGPATAATKANPVLSSTNAAALAAEYPLARFDSQNRVQVEVALDGTVPMAASVASYQARGCEITAQVPWYRQGLISMWMPLGQAGQTHLNIEQAEEVSVVPAGPLKTQAYAGLGEGVALGQTQSSG